MVVEPQNTENFIFSRDVLCAAVLFLELASVRRKRFFRQEICTVFPKNLVF
jgi:hypothetical protein